MQFCKIAFRFKNIAKIDTRRPVDAFIALTEAHPSWTFGGA